MLLFSMKDKQGGFTLVELMFTIVILAVLLGVGIPNFRDFLRNARMTAAANDLLADYNFARSEAVKRRVDVTLCKSTNGAACDTTAGSAFNRWIVFVDDANAATASAEDGNGMVDTGEPILRDTAVAAGITGSSDGHLTIYRTSGFPLTTATGNLSRVLFCDVRKSAITVGGVSAARGLSVSATGRAAVTRQKSVIDATAGAGGFGGCPS